MTFFNLNHSKLPKIEQVMTCWSWPKIMKWPIIFCILKATSIHFLTLHIKEGMKYTSLRSSWKKNGLKVINIDQVMTILSHIWKIGDSSGWLVIFLLHQVPSTWKLLGTFEVICWYLFEEKDVFGITQKYQKVRKICSFEVQNPSL